MAMSTKDWEDYYLMLASGEVTLEMQQKVVQDQLEKTAYQDYLDFLEAQ